MSRSIKKTIGIVLALMMSASIVTGCSTANIKPDNDKLKIVTTIFPEYDWTMNILGEKAKDAEVTLLLDNGVDLHSYQPTADDIMKISTCELFIYVGGESDEWVDGVLKEAVNKNMIVINLLDVLGDKVKEEEVVEGMEEEECEDEGEEEETEFDEHVWLSLKNAEVLCDEIAKEMSKADESNADIYKTNAEAYKEKMDALDNEYKNAIDSATNKTLVFGDRFPFRYLVDDYGLDYYAAFVGCSAETEASFETIVFLAKKADEYKVPAIFTIEGSDNKIAETIRDNTASKNQEILSIDSIQSITSKDVENGASYIDIMSDNLEILKKAIS